MSSLRASFRFAIIAATLGFIVNPATAHHSGSTYFDVDADVVHHNATVIDYVIVNPHGRLIYSFTDEDGNVQEWSAELASANNLRRRGLGGDLMKPGDKLTSVTGTPARSGAQSMRVRTVVHENGDTITFSGRNAGITRAGE